MGLVFLYMPQAPCSVTLQVPHLQVRVQHQALTAFREIGERDLTPQLPVRRAAHVYRVPLRAERVRTHAQVGVLARLLEREQSCEHGSVTFGGHAAGIVESDVAGYAVR